MATAPDVPAIGAALRDRNAARREAACAIQLAARSLAVDPAALSAASYRAFCAQQDESDLPSWLTITVLFVGWQRACEQVTALSYDATKIELGVVLTLYGDPARRHHAYATVGHEPTARPPELTSPDKGA